MRSVFEGAERCEREIASGIENGDFGEAGSTRANCSCIVLKLCLHRVSRLSS